MRNLLICTLVILLVLFTLGCSREVVSSADELVMKNRVATTASGITARLSFYETTGELTVNFPDDTQTVSIKGALAVDDERFYIISDELKKTYTFSYKVYADRVCVTYNGETLVFQNEEIENPS